MKQAGRMKDHVIICGGGNMGQQIMRELDGAEQPCVVIERDEDAIGALRELNPEAVISRRTRPATGCSAKPGSSGRWRS